MQRPMEKHYNHQGYSHYQYYYATKDNTFMNADDYIDRFNNCAPEQNGPKLVHISSTPFDPKNETDSIVKDLLSSKKITKEYYDRIVEYSAYLAQYLTISKQAKVVQCTTNQKHCFTKIQNDWLKEPTVKRILSSYSIEKDDRRQLKLEIDTVCNDLIIKYNDDQIQQICGLINCLKILFHRINLTSVEGILQYYENELLTCKACENEIYDYCGPEDEVKDSKDSSINIKEEFPAFAEAQYPSADSTVFDSLLKK